MFLGLLALMRWVLALMDLLIMTLIIYPLSWVPSYFTRFYFQPLYHFWYQTFVKALGVTLKLHQKNVQPLPQQYILIANHPSVFEDIGMPALFPHLRYLAKRAVKNWWIVGKISQAAGTLYVTREDKQDRERAFEELSLVLTSGDSIGLYPEGGCKGRRIHLPFRYGIFELSLKLNIPIVPVFIHYESQEDFEWQNQHIIQKLWTIIRSQNKTAHYYVYDAIYPTQFASKEEYCESLQKAYLRWQHRYLD